MNRDLVMKYLNSSSAKQEDFNGKLEQFIQKNKDFKIECLLQLKNSNFDQLEQILDDAYQFKVMLIDILHDLNDRDYFLYQICSFINTWYLFNKILEFEDEKEEVNKNIQTLIENQPVSIQLLRYLYKNPRTEYSSIKKAFKSYNDLETIENILNLICDKNIVYKVSLGNYTVYDLTENSRRWVEKNIMSRVNVSWTGGIIPLKRDNGNTAITLTQSGFIIPVIPKKKFRNIAEIKNVYAGKVQTKDILKLDLKSGMVLQTDILNKYEMVSKTRFEIGLGKDGKNGKFEVAGLLKGTK